MPFLRSNRTCDVLGVLDGFAFKSGGRGLRQSQLDGKCYLWLADAVGARRHQVVVASSDDRRRPHPGQRHSQRCEHPPDPRILFLWLGKKERKKGTNPYDRSSRVPPLSHPFLSSITTNISVNITAGPLLESARRAGSNITLTSAEFSK